jgi:hypothetical protein
VKAYGFHPEADEEYVTPVTRAPSHVHNRDDQHFVGPVHEQHRVRKHSRKVTANRRIKKAEKLRLPPDIQDEPFNFFVRTPAQLRIDPAVILKDSSLWEVARSQHAVIISKDEDFAGSWLWATFMKKMLPLLLLLLSGCMVSPSLPKDVAGARRKYRHVKVGMTLREIHSFVGAPSYHSLTGPYTERWSCPDAPAAQDKHTAWLRVIYDGLAATNRAGEVYTGLD